MSKRINESLQSTGDVAAQRVRVSQRLRGVVHALTAGKRGTPLPVRGAHEVSAKPPREVQTNIKQVEYKIGEPRPLHGQKIVVPEHMGANDGNGNNKAVTFDLPGIGGKPVNFSVLRRQDGIDPITATSGYPMEWARRRSKENTPTVTIIPTHQLPLLAQMNRPGISEREFVELQQQISSVSVAAGDQREIGRQTFPGLLGDMASSQHMTIGLSERQSGEHQDAQITIADHSANGTDNVLVHAMGYAGAR